MFYDRIVAARRLSEELKGRCLYEPLVLAIPRGGLVTGAVVAHELNAELDVVVSRKLQTPTDLKRDFGAIAEHGCVYINASARLQLGLTDAEIEGEKARRLGDVRRMKRLFRRVRAAAKIAGRSVIVVDDGLVSGATMISALQAIRRRQPVSLIVAVPGATTSGLIEVRPWCDDVVCLEHRHEALATSEFYEHFRPTTDAEAVALLAEFAYPANSNRSGTQSRLEPDSPSRPPAVPRNPPTVAPSPPRQDA